MVTSREEVLYEYEEILMGKRRNTFTYAFDTPEDKDEIRNRLEVKNLNHNRKIGGYIWNYAITEVLGWEPEDAVHNMTYEIMVALRLDCTLPYMDYNVPKHQYFNYAKILQHAFPGRIRYDLLEETIEEYEHVMGIGNFTNEEEPYRFKKSFFSGSDGPKRLQYILQYNISRDFYDKDIKWLFDFFGDTVKATEYIKKKKILAHYRCTYNSPLDYFYDSLEESEANNILYLNEFLKAIFRKKNLVIAN